MINTKTFRLFISSTFNDFRREREVLQTNVFPKIKEYCAQSGYTFQPIDLRWGVNEEAQLDQKTLEFCLDEVRSCKSYPYPNFLVMLGDRYGWVPLPYAIEKQEFENIWKNIEKNDDTLKIEYKRYKVYDDSSNMEKLHYRQKDPRIISRSELLKQWYTLDENQIPASYILNERDKDSDYKIYENWEAEENALRDILHRGITELDLTEREKRKYFISATEAEIEEGIISNVRSRDYKHIFGFFRDVSTDENNIKSNIFIADNYEKAQDLKRRVKEELKEGNYLHKRTTQLTEKELNESYLIDFENSVIKFLIQQIDQHVAREPKYSLLDIELQEQKYFAEQKRSIFIGHEDLLQNIDNYIEGENNQALILYGKSGMGKSTLIAKAIEKEKKKVKKKILYRFVGATINSTSMEEVLTSIFTELGNAIDMYSENIDDDTFSKVYEKQNYYETFSYRVNHEIKDIEDEVVIFIDSVDQISHEEQFLWLPDRLPFNVKIIISALLDNDYINDSRYFSALQTKSNNLLEMKRLSNPINLLHDILKKEKRTIQKEQEDYFMKQYESADSPLYITVAAEELKHWKSFDIIENDIDTDNNVVFRLERTQRGIIGEYIENLSKIYHHELIFVHKVLGYIYASGKGLSESELIQLLSSDNEFVTKVAPEVWHENKTKELPIVLWVRLYNQIGTFLSKGEEDGEELLYFFHREFGDILKKKSYQKNEHENLLKQIQHFLKLNDKYESYNNRWGKLYIQTLEKFMHEYSDEKKLEVYSIFLLELTSPQQYYPYLKEKTKKSKLNNQYNSTAALVKIQYYIVKKMYSTSQAEDIWKFIFPLLVDLGDIYVEQNIFKSALKYYQEALLYSQPIGEYDLAVMDVRLKLAKVYLKHDQRKEADKIIVEVANKSFTQFNTSKTEKDKRLIKVYIDSNLELISFYIRNTNTVQAHKSANILLSHLKELFLNYDGIWRQRLINLYHLLVEIHMNKKPYDKSIFFLRQAAALIEENYMKYPHIWIELHLENKYKEAQLYYWQEIIKEAEIVINEVLSLSYKEYRIYPDVWADNYTDYLKLSVKISDKNLLLYPAIESALKRYEITTFYYKKDKMYWSDRRLNSIRFLSYLYLKDKQIFSFLSMIKIIKIEFEDSYDSSIEKILSMYKKNQKDRNIIDIFLNFLTENSKIENEYMALFYVIYGKLLEEKGETNAAIMTYEQGHNLYILLFGNSYHLTKEIKQYLNNMKNNISYKTKAITVESNSEALGLLEESLQNCRRIKDFERVLYYAEEIIQLLKSMPEKVNDLKVMELNLPEMILDVASMHQRQNNIPLAKEFYEKALVNFKEKYLSFPKEVSRSYVTSLDNYANLVQERKTYLKNDKKAYIISKEMFMGYPETWNEDYLQSTKNYILTLKKYNNNIKIYPMLKEGMELYLKHILDNKQGLIKNYTIIYLELFKYYKHLTQPSQEIYTDLTHNISQFWKKYMENKHEEYHVFYANIFNYTYKLALDYHKKDLFEEAKFNFSIAMDMALKCYILNLKTNKEIIMIAESNVNMLRNRSTYLHKKKKYKQSFELEFEILNIYLNLHDHTSVKIDNIQECLKMIGILQALSNYNYKKYQKRVKTLLEKHNLNSGQVKREKTLDSKLFYIIDDENIK